MTKAQSSLSPSQLIAEVTRGEGRFLIAEKVDRGPASDLILTWSTRKNAFELIKDCKAVQHDDNRLPRIQIVADDRVFSVQSLDELRKKLTSPAPSIVRYNFGDWSVTWLAQSGKEPTQAQAAMGQVPPGVTEMVTKTVFGVTKRDVEVFFETVRAAI